MKHIKETHSDILSKNFLENSCSYGTRCMFKHRGSPVQNVARPNTRNPAEGASNQTQMFFCQTPTVGQTNLTVGTQNQTETQTELMKITHMMNQLMGQINRMIIKVGLPTQ